MREILFRGKDIETGEWVYGSLVNNMWFHTNDGTPVCEIITGKYESDNWQEAVEEETNVVTVDPTTVGQFTGLVDKNGTQIFEGDIVDSWAGLDKDFPHVYPREVVYRDFGLRFEPLTGYNLCKQNEHLFEVIGNIHDNPELI